MSELRDWLVLLGLTLPLLQVIILEYTEWSQVAKSTIIIYFIHGFSLLSLWNQACHDNENDPESRKDPHFNVIFLKIEIRKSNMKLALPLCRTKPYTYQLFKKLGKQYFPVDIFVSNLEQDKQYSDR